MTDVRSSASARSLADAKRDLLARLLAEEGVDASADLGIARQEGDRHPQSFAQELLWMLDRATPGLTAYNAPIAQRIRGPLDVAALQVALDAMLVRHAAFRTTFETVDGHAMQAISAETRVPLEIVDLRALGVEERETKAAEVLRRASAVPFDLAHDVLLRAAIVRLADDEQLLLLVSHHIVTDGWSYRVLLKELAHSYDAARRGTTPSLEPLALRYVDFAVWQREQLAGERMSTLLEYWKRQLGDLEPLALPTDRPRPSVPGFAGVQRVTALSAELVDALKEVGQRQGATLYMVLLAAYQTLLHRYTGQTDIVVGSPVAGRTRREFEGVAGYFVNTLPLRTRFEGGPSFDELLARVRETCLGAYDHQDVPQERLVLELARDRALSHAPLFQAVMTMSDGTPPEFAAEGMSSADVDINALHDGSSKFDLLLLVTEQAEGMRLLFQARSDLFDGATIERALAHFRTLLEAIVADSSQRVSALPLLTGAERDTLLAFGGTPAATAGTVWDDIQAQARSSADRPAIVAEDGALSYGELVTRSAAVADRLRALGVRPGERVGLALERSAAAMVGMLGIWRAGAAYVPLAPDVPAARVTKLVEQAGVKVAVGDAGAASRLPAGVTLVDPNAAAATTVLADAPLDSLSEPRPDMPAYVLFTSGSTGEPKGVVVTHANLFAYTHAVRQALGLADESETGSGFGWLSTLGADLGHTAVFPALTTGACLHVIAPDVATDAARYGEYVATNPLDVVKITPSHLRALLSGPSGAAVLPARWVVLGGEPCPWDLVEEIAKAGRCRVLNHYGPTETTVGVCALEVTETVASALRSRAATVPIGWPLSDASAHVLDAEGSLVPLGVHGELFIGGAGVAEGYLARPDLTAERFTADSLTLGQSSARLYRTGDRVRRLPSGEIEFLGRLDGQVKVRGYRIETGEVEVALASQPGVTQAGAAVVGGGDAAQLVGFVVVSTTAATTPDFDRIVLDALAAELPAYLVPSRLVHVGSLPLTPNGKLDRRALVALGESAAPGDGGVSEHDAPVAPRTPTEATIAQLWAEVLKRDSVGVTDNFFALGGHSLTAIRVLGKLSREFKQRLPLRAIFESPTVAELALVVERGMVPSTPIEN